MRGCLRAAAAATLPEQRSNAQQRSHAAVSSATLLPLLSAAICIAVRTRSVSKKQGSRLLMVTLRAASRLCRAKLATKPGTRLRYTTTRSCIGSRAPWAPWVPAHRHRSPKPQYVVCAEIQSDARNTAERHLGLFST
jgi:hypothetical protein